MAICLNTDRLYTMPNGIFSESADQHLKSLDLTRDVFTVQVTYVLSFKVLFSHSHLLTTVPQSLYKDFSATRLAFFT